MRQELGLHQQQQRSRDSCDDEARQGVDSDDHGEPGGEQQHAREGQFVAVKIKLI